MTVVVASGGGEVGGGLVLGWRGMVLFRHVTICGNWSLTVIGVMNATSFAQTWSRNREQ